MKKLHIYFFLLVITSMLNTSCHKTWQCECKRNGVVVDVIPIKDVGKMGAKNTCDSYQDQNNHNGDHETCDLK
ncbi:MAG: hypothetical protein JWN78_2144 [Bacteroidota bacterium]|nr:hypothetical protein [Bacteroidota bacterium]